MFLLFHSDDNIVASIQLQNKDMGKSFFTSIIERDTNLLKQEMETERNTKDTVCTFSRQNNSLDPTWEEDYFFTNENTVKLLFKNLNNKKSSGPDKIPNIVLKHIPKKFLKYIR